MLVISLLLGFQAFSPSLVSAQEVSELSEGERVTLGKLFSAAKNAYERRDYPTSIAKLEAAYQIFPSPSILYRVAEMHEELGDSEKAIANYQKFLSESTDLKKQEVVVARIDALKAAAPTPAPTLARLTVETTPAGAAVYLNGTQEQHGFTPIELKLEPGVYGVRLTKEGYESVARTLDVRAGDLRTFDFTLLKTAAPEPAEDSTPVATWVAGGIGVGATIAAFTFLFIAEDRKGRLEDWDDQSGVIERPPEYQDTANKEETYRNLSWVSGGVAVAGFSTALIFYLLRESTEETTLFFDAGPMHAGIRGAW